MWIMTFYFSVGVSENYLCSQLQIKIKFGLKSQRSSGPFGDEENFNKLEYELIICQFRQLGCSLIKVRLHCFFVWTLLSFDLWLMACPSKPKCSSHPEKCLHRGPGNDVQIWPLSQEVRGYSTVLTW